MADPRSDTNQAVVPSSSTSPGISQTPQMLSQQQRTNPDHLYAPPSDPSQQQRPGSAPRQISKRASPLSLPSRQASKVSRSSPSLSPLPQSPVKASQRQMLQPSSQKIRRSSPLRKSQIDGTEPNTSLQASAVNDALPDLSGTHLEYKDYAQEPTFFTRPNRFFGPPSTWRSWTEEERTVATSLERARAMNLSIHLYNAFALKMKAERARGVGRGRSRGPGRGSSAHGSRSQSRSVSRKPSTSRSRSKSKGKGKGKARAELQSNDEMDISSDEVDLDNTAFDPPRLWTAWPLPPSEVPREDLLPSMSGVNAGVQADAYRRPPDPRPSAQLEECLIATTSRIAKERWESREWADEPSSDDERPRKKTKRHDKPGQNTDDGTTAIPMFSSQMFTAHADSDSVSDHGDATDDSVRSSASDYDEPTSSPSSSPDGRRPVVMADDARIRDLLLPSTRHVISQLDRLLAALHTVQRAAYTRKKASQGARGAGEVLGLAPVVFGGDVVERARRRWERLVEGIE